MKLKMKIPFQLHQEEIQEILLKVLWLNYLVMILMNRMKEFQKLAIT